MVKVPVMLNCIECEAFLGVLTEKGLMTGNVMIGTKELMQEEDNHIVCGECGRNIWDSIMPD
jgi:hypothetical protein